MKPSFIIITATALSLAACSGNKSTSIANGTIDIENAIENLEPVTTSMLGKNIRFVPLETNDTALVADQWSLSATDDLVVITNAGQISFGGEKAGVMSFDINTGRYIATIGRQGEGPEEYRWAHPRLDKEGKHAYFSAGNGKGWVKYDLEGNFAGKILPEMESLETGIALISDTIATFIDNPHDENTRRTTFKRYGISGTCIDSIVAFEGQPKESFQLTFDGPIRFESFTAPFINSSSQLPVITCGGKSIILVGSDARYVGNEIHFSETLCDTIYQLTADGLTPSLIFNLGSKGFPFGEVNKRPVQPSEIIIGEVFETPSSVLFSLSKGYPADDNHNTFIGFYNRADGALSITAGADGIRDDLAGFMPFNPVTVTPSGTYVGILTMEAIDAWMELHPDATFPDALADYDPEGNPVLVLID